jgi:hypothetical protein
MARVDILFGTPSSNKEWDWIEKYSDRNNTSIENSLIKNFRFFFETLCETENNGSNYFELVICSIDGDSLKLPKMTVGTYKHNGFVLPKLVIHGDYAVDKDTNKQVFISDTFIEAIGKDIELEFSHEYFGFKRVGKVNLKTSEVVYLIRDKEHIFHNGKFLEIKKKQFI